MTRGVRWSLVGSVVLLALAGCGRGFLQYAEREPWRREAEVACMKSGAVREGAGLVRIEPIEGPGICGAVFPLKVAAFGENSTFGFADEAIRPPGSIPGGAQQPRWPIAQQPRPVSTINASSYPPPQMQPPRSPRLRVSRICGRSPRKSSAGDSLIQRSRLPDSPRGESKSSSA